MFCQLCISLMITHLCKNKEFKNMERKYTSVYLNCCSTFFTVSPQSRHLKVASSSSGRTSLVRVTTPITDVSFPMSAVVSSLNLTTSYCKPFLVIDKDYHISTGKRYKGTENKVNEKLISFYSKIKREAYSIFNQKETKVSTSSAMGSCRRQR